MDAHWDVLLQQTKDDSHLAQEAHKALRHTYPQPSTESPPPIEATLFLKQFFQSKGYYQSRVNWAGEVFFVTLGPETLVRSIQAEVSGPLAQESEYQRFVRSCQAGFLGQRLDHATYMTQKIELEKLIRRLGYDKFYWVSTELIVDVGKNEAYWRWKGVGGPKCYFGTLEYVDSPVREEMLQTLVPFQEGDDYDEAKVAYLCQQLLVTGWFRSVDLQKNWEAIEAGKNFVNLKVRLLSKKFCNGSVQIALGWSEQVSPKIWLEIPRLTSLGLGALFKMQLSKLSIFTNGAEGSNVLPQFGYRRFHWERLLASAQLKFPTPFRLRLPCHTLEYRFSQELVKYNPYYALTLPQSSDVLELNCSLLKSNLLNFSLNGLALRSCYRFATQRNAPLKKFDVWAVGLEGSADFLKTWTIQGRLITRMFQAPFQRFQAYLSGTVPFFIPGSCLEIKGSYQQLFTHDIPFTEFPFELRIFGGGRQACRGYPENVLPSAQTPDEIGAQAGSCLCGTWSIPTSKSGKLFVLLGLDLGRFHVCRSSTVYAEIKQNYWSAGGGIQFYFLTYPINVLIMAPLKQPDGNKNTRIYWPRLLITAGKSLK